MAALDELHHAILGYNKQGRATLLDFLNPDPEKSLLAKCQGKLLGLLRNLSVDAPQWKLLGFVGGHFESIEIRILARKTVVQLSAGVNFYFERPWSKGFHSLVVILPDVHMDIAVQMRVLRAFYGAPLLCLTLGDRRLRMLGKTPEEARRILIPPVRVAMSKAIVSCDPVERCHAQFRQCDAG